MLLNPSTRVSTYESLHKSSVKRNELILSRIILRSLIHKFETLETLIALYNGSDFNFFYFRTREIIYRSMGRDPLVDRERILGGYHSAAERLLM